MTYVISEVYFLFPIIRKILKQTQTLKKELKEAKNKSIIKKTKS